MIRRARGCAADAFAAGRGVLVRGAEIATGQGIGMVHQTLEAPITGETEMAALWSDASLGAAMVRVEAALARVQGALGLIPTPAAQAIAALDGAFIPDPAVLAAGTAAAGVPVPALVAALRDALGDGAADWVHYGATSQDIIDTALILMAGQGVSLLAAGLASQIDDLQQVSADHAGTVMAGRTRGQLATPITFGLRVANWAQPLIGAEAALPDLRAVALRVQSGGASGAQTAIAPHGPAVSDALAADLGLTAGPPWHTDRTPLMRLADWLMQVITAEAKIARDVIVLSRGEIAELRAGLGGGSSTMPQKANPVTAEAILTTAHLAGALHGALLTAGGHAEERDGALWAVEWHCLPRLFELAAAAVRHGQVLARTLAPDVAAMQARVDAHPELWAEAVVFALAPDIGRVAAQALVKTVLADDRPFAQALAAHAPEGFDAAAVIDPARIVGPAGAVAADIFAARRREKV